MWSLDRLLVLMPREMKMTISIEDQPRWPAIVLRIAAIYNIVWGLWVIALPNHLFDLTGIQRPNYPGIWQCVGMIVGVYGIGYWIAAKDFVVHWPIVLVGLIGKVLGPIGFVHSLFYGLLPWSWGFTILTNDVVWWVPFGGMLYIVLKHQSDPRNQNALKMPHKEHGDEVEPEDLSVERVSSRTIVSNGINLWELGLNNKLLMVFVRHAGCTFCRETLNELKEKLPGLQSKRITPVVIHLGSPEEGQKMLDRSGLSDTLAISNPTADLYRAYELKRGQLSQLLGPRVWWRGFKSAILKGNGTGALVGDGFQLGGAFLVENGRITKSFPAKDASDKVPFECLLD